MNIYSIAKSSPISDLATTDSNFIVGSGSAWVAESGNTARTSLGLGTTNSPTFTDVYLSDGEVGVPSLAFTSDADTGLYYTAPAGSPKINMAIAGAQTYRFGVSTFDIKDNQSVYYLTILPSGTAMTADRQLTLDMNNAARTLDLTGNATLNQDVSTTASPTFAGMTLDFATQDYLFTQRADTILCIQGQTAGSYANLDLFTKDGDGTDATYFEVFGLGTPAAVDNREFLQFGWNAASSIYIFSSVAAGTGTVRPLHIFTGANTNQVVLNIDGSMDFSGGGDFAGTVEALTLGVGMTPPATGYGISIGSSPSADQQINIYHDTVDGVIDISAGTIRVDVAGAVFLANDGTGNLFLGDDAFDNDPGENNVGMGYHVGYYNNTTGDAAYGDRNVYIGFEAGKGAAGGNFGYLNVAIGEGTLPVNTTGKLDVALGAKAGALNTSGYGWTAVGSESLGHNTQGYRLTAIGNTALHSNTIGDYSVGIGYRAGFNNRTGNYNTWIGSYAGNGVFAQSNTYNTGIGYAAGYGITSGDSNVFIGANAGRRQTTLSNLLIVDRGLAAGTARASAADEITNSILYGVMADTPAAQTLNVNAVLNCTENIQVDATQVLTNQQVHIVDAPGDTTANNATTINAILAMLETHGLVAAA